MDHLWSPWRYRYIVTTGSDEPCIFCAKPAENNDSLTLIIHRGSGAYVILNAFPYASGHVMVVPFAHVAELESLKDETLVEMTLLAKRAERHLRAIYHPEGLNLGMNIGRCAGAGIAGHLHLHVVPRWTGDANFMSTIGETRIMPE